VKSEVRLIRTPVCDLDYWLCRCEGFRVDSPTGRVGIVAEGRYGTRLDRPDVLAVRSGRFGRLLIVPIEEVADLVPREERILLSHAPESMQNELRLRHLLVSAARSARARDVFAALVARLEPVRAPVRLAWRSLRRGRGGG